jgi:hypothetical protein
MKTDNIRKLIEIAQKSDTRETARAGEEADIELEQILETSEMWQERSAGYALEVTRYRDRERLLFSYIRQCLPYVRDMVGVASAARILEQQIVDLLDERNMV